MIFDIHILGSGSAIPKLHRNHSAQYINVLERHLLIDCGEGTQLQLQRFKVKSSKIDHVFISHLHGDHYLGLLGFLSSSHLLGRTKKMHLYAPPDLQDIIFSQFSASKTTLGFDIHFVPLTSKSSEMIFEDNLVEVWTIPLKHRIYCNGFLIREKPRGRRINKEAILKHEVPVAMMHQLIAGRDWQKENANGDMSTIPNEVLTLPPIPSRLYAYCSDTKFYTPIIPMIKEIDLLYHEATFLEDNKVRASKTFHSTAMQAADIAKQADVKKLLLGHFSAKYRSTEAFEKEAATIFEHSIAVKDGDVFSIPLQK